MADFDDALRSRVIGHERNEALATYLRNQATVSKQEYRAYDIDEFELHAHPDLIERMERLAEFALAGYQEVPVYGIPVLATPDDVAFAFAEGTSRLVVRLAVRPPGSEPHVELDAWWVLDAWGAEVPTNQHLLQLAELMRVAVDQT